MPKVLFFDLETVGDSRAADLIDKQKIKVPGNYKDISAIAKKRDEEYCKMLGSLALYPRFAQIVCIVARPINEYGEDEAEEERVFVGDEKKILEEFCEYVREKDRYILCTFNGRKYDLRVLRARCCLHRIEWPYPAIYRQSKYSLSPHYDLYLALTSYGEDLAPSGMNTLESFYAYYIGDDLTNPCAGNKIAQLWERGNIDEIVEHCRVDVRMLEKLYLRISNWYNV